MSLKILDVVFLSSDDFITDLKGALFKGKKSKKMNEAISFDSFETFKRLMTPNKLEILMCITRVHPESIKQLAKYLNREYPHVLKDCRSLEALGFIKLVEVDAKRKQLTPHLAFDYDLIRVRSKVEEFLVISEASNRVLLEAVGQ